MNAPARTLIMPGGTSVDVERFPFTAALLSAGQKRMVDEVATWLSSGRTYTVIDAGKTFERSSYTAAIKSSRDRALRLLGRGDLARKFPEPVVKAVSMTSRFD